MKDLWPPSNPESYGSRLKEDVIVPINPYSSLLRGPQKQERAAMVLVVGLVVNPSRGSWEPELIVGNCQGCFMLYASCCMLMPLCFCTSSGADAVSEARRHFPIWCQLPCCQLSLLNHVSWSPPAVDTEEKSLSRHHSVVAAPKPHCLHSASTQDCLFPSLQGIGYSVL